MNIIKYKDYQASVDFEDGALFIKVLHVDDLLIAEFENAADAEKVFANLIKEYLADCASNGRQPSKPFKGSFNVRIAAELHRRAAMTAAEEGQSLNSWISAAIHEKLECTGLSNRINGVFAKKQEEIALSIWQSHFQQTAAREMRVAPRPSGFRYKKYHVSALVDAANLWEGRKVHG